MAANTSIEWAHHTMNPWRGCAKVSAGCKNCYAEHAAPVRIARSKGLETWGAGAAREIASESMWKQPLLWDRKAKEAGERHRVFCASLADVFEDYQGPSAESVNAARLRLWALIEATPHLDWLLLTKRPQNVLGMIPEKWRNDGLPSNAWMGCTAENQEEYDARIDHLQAIPARIHFLSCEPLLGPIDMHKRYVDWVIIGGESGPGARKCLVTWISYLAQQCKQGDVKIDVFVKQLGANPSDYGKQYEIATKKGNSLAEFPASLRLREVPQ